ncbi:MAG: helix-turn-helix transcriptional regulator [bacterium]
MKTLLLDDVIKEKIKDEEFRIYYEDELIKNRIAKAVMKIRQKEGITQKELAQKARTSQPVIARLEKGTDTRVPSLKLLHKIAHALGKEVVISFKAA